MRQAELARNRSASASPGLARNTVDGWDMEVDQPGLKFQFFVQSGPFGLVGLGLDRGRDQVGTRPGPVGTDGFGA